MSYILQGSGSVLGPCLSHIVNREITRLAPCICLNCKKLVSSFTVPDRGKSVTSSHNHGFSTSSSPNISKIKELNTNQPVMLKNLTQVALDRSFRSKYSNPRMRESFFTSYNVPSSPLCINLTLSVAPEHVTGLSYRLLHTSPPMGKKASSKIEETVIRLKEKQDDALAEVSKVQDLEKKIASVIEAEDLAVKIKVEQKKEAAPKKGVWDKIVTEAKHYYSGFKLLFLDVKVSSQIVWKIAQGKTLSRRENRQLVRTVSDLFRLVPFSVFIIVPFMELLLPVALKLFPGMLPSTFASADERETKMRRQLKAKLEYAKFLQKTLDEMSPADKEIRSQSASDFVKFYDSVKKTGAVDSKVTNKDILKFSKLFEDEITLDNMTRGQLIAVCRLLDLTPIGTNAFLRFQIEMQMRKLKADDVIIAKEGVENMTVMELQVACKDRGMRALGLTKDKLVMQLRQWIELSTNEKVPPSLLLLSRTLYLPENLAPEKAIEASISALPETVATGAKAKLGEREGKIENVTRLEIIKQEQAKIAEEEKEEKLRAEAKKKKESEEKARLEQLAQVALEKAKAEQNLGVLPPPTAEAIVKEASSFLRKATVGQDGVLTSSEPTVIDALEASGDDIHVATAEVIQESASTSTKTKSTLDQELSSKDLTALRAAIQSISKNKGKDFVQEHGVLHELRQELLDYEEDLGEMKEVAESTGRHLKQTKGAARLFKMVNTVLARADTVVNKLETRESKIKTDIDSLDKVGENKEDQEEHLVTVQDLLSAVRGLQQVPDADMLERISEVVASMDEDSDGVIKIEHVNKVIEILGCDNVELSAKQIKQIIDLIGKEEMLEVESKIEKILGKLPTVEQKLTATKSVIEKDLTEQPGDNALNDQAEEMNEEANVEVHITEMFSRKTGTNKKVVTDDHDAPQNTVSEDNSVKEVLENVKEREDEPVKVPHKNGSN